MWPWIKRWRDWAMHDLWPLHRVNCRPQALHFSYEKAGLTLPDQHPQSDIIAFGTLGFLDAAVAHLDPLRDAAHGDRIGRVSAGALRRLDQALGQRRQRRLIEQVGVGRLLRKRR